MTVIELFNFLRYVFELWIINIVSNSSNILNNLPDSVPVSKYLPYHLIKLAAQFNI